MRRIFTFLFVFLVMIMPSFAIEIIDLPDCAFKYSAQTSASKARVWELWKDVEHWKHFDERLQYSYLDGDKVFKLGATGVLKGKGAPKTKFTITEFNDGVSFVERLHLPLYQSIDLKRYYEEDVNGQTVFTHEVQFIGSLRYLYYLILAGPFKKDLKLVVNLLKVRAEEAD